MGTLKEQRDIYDSWNNYYIVINTKRFNFRTLESAKRAIKTKHHNEIKPINKAK